MIILSLVAPFVSEPRHQNLHFSSCSLWLCTHGPNLFPEDICYSIVDEDASNARLSHGLLHNYSAGRFATSLSILFGNCVEKIAEKLLNTTGIRHIRDLLATNAVSPGTKGKKIKSLYLFMRLLTFSYCM